MRVALFLLTLLLAACSGASVDHAPAPVQRPTLALTPPPEAPLLPTDPKQPTEAAPAGAETSTPAGIMLPSSGHDSAWAVQLGAYRDTPSALAAWRRLADQYVTLLKPRAPYQARRSELSAESRLIALLAGPLMAFDDAFDLCSGLRAQGASCWVYRQPDPDAPVTPIGEAPDQ